MVPRVPTPGTNIAQPGPEEEKMIVGKRKELEDIKQMLSGSKKVLVVGLSKMLRMY